jgi:uncharacterized metal-binding protein YceD (DUF177 family)
MTLISPPDDGDLLKVSRVLQGPSGLPLEEFRLKSNYLLEEIPTDGPISCAWLIYPRPSGLTVKGRLKAVLALECTRCLAQYKASLSLDIEEEYMFSRFNEGYGKEKELQADDFYETVDENGSLDLKDLLRQCLLLEVEEYAFCGREDCHFVAADSSPL